MTAESDKERNFRERIISLLRHLDNQVWSIPLFPIEHRPDVDYLAQNIIIGEYMPQDHLIHPSLKPKVRRMMEMAAGRTGREIRTKKIAWHDAQKRHIMIFGSTMRLPDFPLMRCIAHECATDLACSARIIKPCSYSSSQIESIKELLRQSFDKRRRPRIEETRIEKIGFRELLYHGNFYISEVVGDPLIFYLNEVYPVVFEILTAHILNMDCGILRFSSLAREGQLTSLPHEQYPAFTSTLYEYLKYIDWRDILSAFQTGELDETYAILDRANSPAFDGIDVIVHLTTSMIEDERRIQELSSKLPFGC